MEKISFAVACKKFFGLLSGQGIGAFVADIRNLTKEDRTEMAPLLSAALGEDVSAEITVSK
jgi:hypothetical protein